MKEAKEHVKCDVKPRQMLGYHPECIEGLIHKITEINGLRNV